MSSLLPKSTIKDWPFCAGGLKVEKRSKSRIPTTGPERNTMVSASLVGLGGEGAGSVGVSTVAVWYPRPWSLGLPRDSG